MKKHIFTIELSAKEADDLFMKSIKSGQRTDELLRYALNLNTLNEKEVGEEEIGQHKYFYDRLTLQQIEDISKKHDLSIDYSKLLSQFIKITGITSTEDVINNEYFSKIIRLLAKQEAFRELEVEFIEDKDFASLSKLKEMCEL